MSHSQIRTICTRVQFAAALAIGTLALSAAPAGAEFHIPPGGFEVGTTDSLAGGHPFALDTKIEFATTTDNLGKTVPDGSLRNADINLPPGLVGNPQAVEPCEEAQLATDECPIDSQVGLVNIFATDESSSGNYPLYNMVAPPGEPAQLGFSIENIVWVHLATSVRPDGTITATAKEVTQLVPLAGATTTIWGVPADPAHNPDRICHPAKTLGCESGEEEKPFLSLPTSCTGPQEWSLDAISWQQPDNEATASLQTPGNEGCSALEFEPSLEARPSTDAADSPSGFDFNLHLPQNEDPKGRAEAHLKDLELTLPEGLVVNPSSANGLEACSSTQIGIDPASGTPNPEPPSCPDASKIGTVKVDTPLLADPLPGALYLAAPYDNPFNSLLALYTVIDDEKTGVRLKIAAKVEADPSSGRLKITALDLPQVPFEDLKVNLKIGAAAALRTPSTCGPYTSTAALTPHSAPESGPPASRSDGFAISRAANGTGDCPTSAATIPNTPGFDGGTVSPIARAFSPFALNLRRADGSQQFSSLKLSLPPGLLAKVVDTPRCSEAALAAAAARSGAQEKAFPSCPAASEVGSVVAGAGAGPAPYYTRGTAYVTGPYKGAPVGVAVITPAVAGPFDLGTIVVRAALHVDPDTGQAIAQTDPIPAILQGIPLDVRSVQLRLDKPDFTFNPTSCDEMALSGTLLSTLNQPAALFNRFQAAECSSLAFKPKLSLRLTGSTKRGGHPALQATLTPGPGQANIARISAALPHSEFLDTTHIRTICTRVQFAANTCPQGSIYGHIKAFAPLFATQPFEGPVYLRSSSNPLPDLVAALRGPPELPAALNLVGRIDSVHGGTRATFAAVPDVPFAKAILNMRGGKKGLLLNSRNLCTSTNRATVKMDGQNGKVHDTRPKLKAAKCKKKQHKRRSG